MMICENLTSSAEDIVNQPHAQGDIEMNNQGLLFVYMV